MTRDDFLQKQYELSVQAGMNQRYHQKYATLWWRWDASIRGATAAAAVVAALLSLASAMAPASTVTGAWSVGLSVLTTIIAVVLNVIPVGSWEQTHRDLLRQWTDLREDIETLLFDCPGEPENQILCEMKKLDAKIHRLCGQEPSPNEDVIRFCFDAEQKSRRPAEAA